MIERKCHSLSCGRKWRWSSAIALNVFWSLTLLRFWSIEHVISQKGPS